PGVIDRFARLADCPEVTFVNAVAEFARQHGLLGICDHQKLIGHAMGCQPQRLRDANIQIWSPIECWRRYSQQVRGILGIIARLQTGSPGHQEDWDAVGGGDPPKKDAPSGLPAATLTDWPAGTQADFAF